MQVTWKSRQGSYNGGPPPSAVHGWLKKLHGVVTFSRSRIRQGRHEIEDARALRDTRMGRADGVEAGAARSLHPHHRCRPGYHGMHLRLWGFLTRRRDHMARGLAMREDAERERRHERRRRQRHLADEGLAIRMGAQTLIRPRGSRRRHHSDHGYGHRSRSHRSEPRVIVTQPGETVQVNTGAATMGTDTPTPHRSHAPGAHDASTTTSTLFPLHVPPRAAMASTTSALCPLSAPPAPTTNMPTPAHVAIAAPSSSSHHGHHRHRSRSHRSPSVAYVST
ncbi:hypothetical protein DFH11DRAFT_1874811 [Phellopilus nigrolimitatus]|nr:hypothetical protein DFH11DRAFT_1874811 [Phellopilus nigrolimitatus]